MLKNFSLPPPTLLMPVISLMLVFATTSVLGTRGGGVHLQFSTTAKRMPLTKLFEIQQHQLQPGGGRANRLQEQQLSEGLKKRLAEEFQSEVHPLVEERKKMLTLFDTMKKEMESYMTAATKEGEATEQEEGQAQTEGGSNIGGDKAVASKSYDIWLDVANISVGNPPQSFQVLINDYCANLYLIDSNANYTSAYGGRRGAAVKGKQTFNASASTSYKANETAEFHSYSYFAKGNVGSDQVALVGGEDNNFSPTLQFQLANRVSPGVKYINESGVLGLAIRHPYSSSSKETLPIAQQLAEQMEQPIITRYRYTAAGNGTGAIGFGTLLPEHCQASEWTTVSNSKEWQGSISYLRGAYSILKFDIVGVSAAHPMKVDVDANSNACDECAPVRRVNANITVKVVRDNWRPYFSYQVFDLIVQALGAVWDKEEDAYVLSAKQFDSANPVTLHLSNGGTLDLLVQDLVEKKGEIYHLRVVFNHYDQNRLPHDIIYVGPQLLNHLCISQNINTGETRVVRSLDQQPMEQQPGKSSECGCDDDSSADY